jgi:hypothetical protein
MVKPIWAFAEAKRGFAAHPMSLRQTVTLIPTGPAWWASPVAILRDTWASARSSG